MSKTEKNNMTIEQALTALNEAVEDLEDSSLKLEEHIEIYDRASKLALLCHERLSGARLRIENIDERLDQIKRTDTDQDDAE